MARGGNRMQRREFLAACAAAPWAGAAEGSAPAPQSDAPDDGSQHQAFVIVDPHAHPQSIFPSRSYDRTTPTPETLRAARLAVCAFSAVGDLAYLRGGLDAPFNDTRNQLQRARDLAERNQVHPVLKAADLPSIGTPTAGVLALLAIEGADALEGRISHLDRFHEDGVRLLTLVHERNNELGFTQRSNTDGPLTPFGVEVVERMNVRGMLIDVAHAKTQTLKSIVDVSARPVIDSHTSPLPAGEEGAGPRRLRTWQEMEWVASTGGVICTWPLAHSGRRAERSTLRHWAEEIVTMKMRLGMAHVGFGSDSGGGLPRLLDGWRSQASLPALITAMRQAGLSQDDMAAFLGGNVLRVLQACLS